MIKEDKRLTCDNIEEEVFNLKFKSNKIKKLLYKHSFKKLSIYELLKTFFKDYNFKISNLWSLFKFILYKLNSTSIIVNKI